MMTVPERSNGPRMWETITSYFLAKCLAQQGRVYELCGDCNATTLPACLEQFVRVYTEERETTQGPTAALPLAAAGPALPEKLALAQTTFSETAALPDAAAATKYAWVEFVGDDDTATDLAAELASDVTKKTDAALTQAAITDATIIAGSSAHALLPSLATASAAALALMALLL